MVPREKTAVQVFQGVGANASVRNTSEITAVSYNFTLLGTSSSSGSQAFRLATGGRRQLSDMDLAGCSSDGCDLLSPAFARKRQLHPSRRSAHCFNRLLSANKRHSRTWTATPETRKKIQDIDLRRKPVPVEQKNTSSLIWINARPVRNKSDADRQRETRHLRSAPIPGVVEGRCVMSACDEVRATPEGIARQLRALESCLGELLGSWRPSLFIGTFQSSGGEHRSRSAGETRPR